MELALKIVTESCFTRNMIVTSFYSSVCFSKQPPKKSYLGKHVFIGLCSSFVFYIYMRIFLHVNGVGCFLSHDRTELKIENSHIQAVRSIDFNPNNQVTCGGYAL